MDFESEIKAIVNENRCRSYSKKLLDGKQRILFSVLAEKNGLISYSSFEGDNVKKPCLIVSPPLNEIINYNNESIYTFFSNYCGLPVKGIEDIQIYGLQSQWQDYLRALARYGYFGLKRRSEIFQEFLVTYISDFPAYQTFIQGPKPTLLGSVSKPFTINKKIYKAGNHDMIYISVDVRASIFQAYHSLGIIPESTWEEFIGQFTNDSFLINDKKLRLKVFGKLDKNRINPIIISNTIIPFSQLLEPIFGDRMLAVEGDEIIISTGELGMHDLERIMSLNSSSNLNVVMYRLKYHSLGEIENNANSYYSRHFLYPPDKKPDIKCASPDIVRDAYRSLMQNN